MAEHWEQKTVLVQTASDREKLDALLAAGWEPYAVTETDAGGPWHHLRRCVDTAHSGGTDA